jgi:hypothetical protein
MRLWHDIFMFWRRHEHHLGVGALVIGFTFDLWIAKRPDSVADNLLLLTYLLVAGALIVILNLRETRRKEQTSAEPLFFLLILQFCFGGLASNLLVLYGHSGTLAGSAVFVGLLGCLVLGNEYLRGRYVLLRFNVGVYYFLLLTYCIIATPTFIFHSLGTGVFLASGAISLVFIGVFLVFLYSAVLRKAGGRGVTDVLIIIAAIFGIFSGLYFLDIIPPVPLAMKSLGIYHSVLKRSDGTYIAIYEPVPWWEFWRDTSPRYTLTAGDSAFCFSSVFAPADLTAPIYHTWEYYNPATKDWEARSRLAFPISGGRSDGYRGFSVKAGLTPGEWRCDVETASGALIGRVSFTAVESSTTPTLSQTTL